MSSGKLPVVLVAVLLVVSVGGVAAVADGSVGVGSPTNAQQGDCDYASLYDRTIDAVVSIRTGVGQGSGFVYRAGAASPSAADGGLAANASLVVTNAHVVGNATEVTVQFRQGEYRNATVVGRDRFSDLAVVRVNATPGYVSALQVAGGVPERGTSVAALGNPLGLEETITQGIVSGVNRSIRTRLGFAIPDAIQTDAAISPGNSGGPLVTCDGSVVGVNTAGIVAGGAENIGFAVSASLVDRVVPALVERGEFDYPFLGVATAEVTPTVARANDLNSTDGVLVTGVVEGGPAGGVLQGATGFESVSGVEVPVGGDVMLAIDGRSIDSSEALGSYLVTQTSPRDTVTLTVLRDGERRQVNVTLQERPDPETM
jgi:S1-C subfamily serine protease